MSTSHPPDGFLALSESKMYKDYAEAFVQGTGLPLNLSSPETLWLTCHEPAQSNPFCALLQVQTPGCAACYSLQCRVENDAQQDATTLQCFAGLYETAVPVRAGGKLIAFLKTGQILLRTPDPASIFEMASKLEAHGVHVDLLKAEQTFSMIRVFTEAQYESLVRLLSLFAEQLAHAASALILAHNPEGSPLVGRACLHIQENLQEPLSLGAVAKKLHVSAAWLSQKFKQSTGMNFVEYVSRTRVEKARVLLANPNRRVSEIAFDVGFQSLSQFNRAFKKFTGKSPTVQRLG